MVQFIPGRNEWADAFREIGAGASQGYMNRADEIALQKAISSLPENATPRQRLDAITNTKTHSPAAKQGALKNYLGVSQFEEVQRHAKKQEDIANEKNRIAALGKKTEQDTEALKENLIADGYPEYLADLYVKSPPSVQNRLTAEHNELKARGLRSPLGKQSEGAEPNQPQETAEQKSTPPFKQTPEDSLQTAAPIAEEIVAQEEPKAPEKEWPDIPPPAETTPAEREKWRSANQKENNTLLKSIKEKNNSHRNAIIRYGRLTNLNDSKKITSGIGRLVIDPNTGEPYPTASILGLVNKETQDFVKTVNDFLIDAKNYFGSRVTNFDISSFKSRLPTLLNTEEGRRLIIEQMKLMEELQIVHDKELENGFKHYGRNASYSDIQKVVDNKTVSKEEQIINKVNNLDKATNYLDIMAKDPKYKDARLMQDQKTGKFKAFRPGEVATARSKGWVEW